MYNQPSTSQLTSTSYHNPHSMTNHGIHGNLLEVTVVGCNKLKDTEWFSRQDPYVCVEYGSNKNRTRTCTDGGKNPKFQEKFIYSLIEGLTELNITVWNSNTLSHDDFIGSGKVQLAKVLSHGYDGSSWPLCTKTGRHAGEVRLIMHYSNANNPANSYAPSASPYGASSALYSSMYSAPPLASSMSYYPPPTLSVSPYPLPTSSMSTYPPATSSMSTYPPAPTGAYSVPSSYSSYPANSSTYPTSTYPTNSSVYPPPPYPPQSSPYPPQPYTSNSVYPPQPYGSNYTHSSSNQGVYPPPY